MGLAFLLIVILKFLDKFGSTQTGSVNPLDQLGQYLQDNKDSNDSAVLLVEIFCALLFQASTVYFAYTTHHGNVTIG